MIFSDFAKQLPTKRRTLNDIARFISTRTDENPNYTLLLGAGCSVTSGITSGASLSKIWRDEIYRTEIEDKNLYSSDIEHQRDYLKQYCSNWYDPSREYSCLFERKFDLQRQRRMFVEAEVSEKKPSIGYAYLTDLVEKNYFGTIFTTNFDDLINEAFYLYSENRPIVCAHDSSINSITVTSRRPKIIKLHGDYLFDDIKSTARETESLEQNMKEKFIEFSKDFGLIIVGYAGGDRSIMDLLSMLLKNEDYFKGGIYWCVRQDSEVTEDLRKLLWKDRVFFVEIDGFDEMFAQLYAKLNNGEVLPLSALSVSRRPNEIVTKLLASPTMFPQTNDILKQARERLLRQSKRIAIADSIASPDSADRSPFENSDLTEDELLIATEIQRLISGGGYSEAISKTREHLRSAQRKIFKRQLLRSIITAQRLLGQFSMAADTSDELIALQPKNASNYLLKADSSDDVSQRVIELNRALEVDPYSVKAHLELARHYSRISQDCYGKVADENREKAIDLLSKALTLDPSNRNPAWTDLFYIYKSQAKDDIENNKDLNNIIEKLSLQNPYSHRVLSMKEALLSRRSKAADFDKCLKDIRFAQEKYSDGEDCMYFDLSLGVLDKANRLQELKSEIQYIEARIIDSKDSDLAVKIASVIRTRIGDDEKAIQILSEALRSFDFNGDVFSNLIEAYVDSERFDEADKLFSKFGHRVVPHYLSQLYEKYYIAKGHYEAALKEHKNNTGILGVDRVNRLVFILLLKGEFREAEQVSRDFLTKCSFTPEAAAEIVNFEIARKGNGAKIDQNRLEGVLKTHDSHRVKAAVFALLGRKNEAIASLREILKTDFTFRHEAKTWPAFSDIRSDPAFIKEIEACRTVN